MSSELFDCYWQREIGTRTNQARELLREHFDGMTVVLTAENAQGYASIKGSLKPKSFFRSPTIQVGAGGGNRTPTGQAPLDFESSSCAYKLLFSLVKSKI